MSCDTMSLKDDNLCLLKVTVISIHLGTGCYPAQDLTFTTFDLLFFLGFTLLSKYSLDRNNVRTSNVMPDSSVHSRPALWES